MCDKNYPLRDTDTRLIRCCSDHHNRNNGFCKRPKYVNNVLKHFAGSPPGVGVTKGTLP